MDKLIAVADVLHDNRQYRPGDVLPDIPEMVPLWIRAGSAIRESDNPEQTAAKAKRVTAKPAKSGQAEGSG